MAESDRKPASSTGGTPKRLSPAELMRSARDQFEEFTGRSVESVSSFGRAGDGWQVKVEVVELERIPDTTSVLATYRIQLGPDGEIAGYERVARYARGRLDA
ncbi:gas vesicle protein [Amycolatopsis sp. NPDC059021]|uniref:gas vesicle protein GvpO n=1 Tax=Amycolatopsis sp. NPDC059021 TaxID=3346704 RepID=UPI00366E20B5